jgi:mannose-6-phosphate isomerase
LTRTDEQVARAPPTARAERTARAPAENRQVRKRANVAPYARRLAPNPVPIFYAGGPTIAEFRGIDSFASPEDWVGSVTEVRLPDGGTGGLAHTEDGTGVRELLQDDPAGWLGREDRSDETGLLVKLLDAGQRLPVHWHPDRPFASAHLSCAYGKAEGWIILSPARGRVWLGFVSPPSKEQLDHWLDTQDGEDMLAHMHEVVVDRGDVIFVPPGTPHAIDRGVFLLELQEPTAFSFVLEYGGFNLSRHEAALGIEWSTALDSLHFHPDLVQDSVVRDAIRTSPDSLFPASADRFFRASVLDATRRSSVIDTFAIAIVVDGSGTLRAANGTSVAVAAGTTWALPAASGELVLEGDTSVVVCQPPAHLPTR